MNEASQPSQQNTIIEEIKHRVLEVDALRNGTKHPEEIELPLDYIAALDEITTIEREEIEVIEQFLPQPLCGQALEAAVNEVVADLGASKLKDLGRCMSELKARFPESIESGTAGKVVREALSKSSS